MEKIPEEGITRIFYGVSLIIIHILAVDVNNNERV